MIKDLVFSKNLGGRRPGSGRPILDSKKKKIVKSVSLSPQAVKILENHIELYPDDCGKKFTVSSLIERLIRNHL